VGANHSILVGSNLSGSTDFLKHWGIKVAQTTAATEVTPKSFIFEIWDGSEWVEMSVMATHSSLFYRYANEVFIRENISEHIRFGLNTNSTWAKKTIDGKNLYWSRIRIQTTLTTAPVFDQFKLSTNRSEINSDGTHTFHGSSRFRQSLIASGNIFGEEGAGVVDVAVSVGTGGLPTGWNHNVKNSELNQNGDAIHTQFTLPRGIDTSQPLNIKVIFTPSPAGADAAEAIMSVLPVEVAGISEADPTGGIVPVSRTVANTETLTAKVAQTLTDSSVDAATTGKLVSLSFTDFDISDYYEGDMVLIRFELNDDGDNNVDLAVFSLEVSGVNWTHGDKL
jgi:hypothetical protein